jgi:hypothetical protein
MNEHIKDRLIGVFVTAITGIAAFLLVNYLGSFVSRAEFNHEISGIIQNQLRIIDDLKIIKEALLERK